MYEPKWDGFRLAISRPDIGATLWSRNGTDLTGIFPELAAAAAAQLPPGCVVDGEAVIWTDDRLDFDALQHRMARGERAATTLAAEMPSSYVAFDVLAVEDTDVRHLPLAVRRTLLEQLAVDWVPPLHLSPWTADIELAREWYATLPATGIEGLVVKGAAQTYRGGERQWLKVKHRATADVVAAAVTGSLARPETLVLGRWDGGELRIIGRTTPLSAAAARQLAPLLHAPTEHPWPLRVNSSVIDRFSRGRDPVELLRIEPLTVEVSADVAKAGESFRHAVRFVRARPDVDAGPH